MEHAIDVLGMPVGARRDLPKALESDTRVRADVIKQFYERGKRFDGRRACRSLRPMIKCRQQVVEELRRTVQGENLARDPVRSPHRDHDG